jgi:predicted transcriptional regulator
MSIIDDMTSAERNVLEALYDRTRSRTGKTKCRVSGDSYYANVINSLYSKGLIDWQTETVHGDGYAVTDKGASLLGKA